MDVKFGTNHAYQGFADSMMEMVKGVRSKTYAALYMLNKRAFEVLKMYKCSIISLWLCFIFCF